jgi:hypothetical protein
MTEESEVIIESATTDSHSQTGNGHVDSHLEQLIKDKQDEFGLFDNSLFTMPRIFDDGNYIVGEPENFGVDDGIMSATSPTASATSGHSGTGSFDPPSPANCTHDEDDKKEGEYIEVQRTIGCLNYKNGRGSITGFGRFHAYAISLLHSNFHMQQRWSPCWPMIFWIMNNLFIHQCKGPFYKYQKIGWGRAVNNPNTLNFFNSDRLASAAATSSSAAQSQRYVTHDLGQASAKTFFFLTY